VTHFGDYRQVRRNRLLSPFCRCCNRRFLLCCLRSIARKDGSGSSAGHDKEGRMLKEFQEFISKGNVMDLAVGVIIGAAFG
jgi:hypothetical protein